MTTASSSSPARTRTRVLTDGSGDGSAGNSTAAGSQCSGTPNNCDSGSGTTKCPRGCSAQVIVAGTQPFIACTGSPTPCAAIPGSDVCFTHGCEWDWGTGAFP